MSGEQEQPIIVSMRVRDAREVAAGSIAVPCHGCREPVWISPASQSLVAKTGTAAYCAPCVLAMQSGGEKLEGFVTRETLGEVAAHLAAKRHRRN